LGWPLWVEPLEIVNEHPLHIVDGQEPYRSALWQPRHSSPRSSTTGPPLTPRMSGSGAVSVAVVVASGIRAYMQFAVQNESSVGPNVFSTSGLVVGPSNGISAGRTVTSTLEVPCSYGCMLTRVR